MSHSDYRLALTGQPQNWGPALRGSLGTLAPLRALAQLAYGPDVVVELYKDRGDLDMSEDPPTSMSTERRKLKRAIEIRRRLSEAS